MNFTPPIMHWCSTRWEARVRCEPLPQLAVSGHPRNEKSTAQTVCCHGRSCSDDGSGAAARRRAEVREDRFHVKHHHPLRTFWGKARGRFHSQFQKTGWPPLNGRRRRERPSTGKQEQSLGVPRMKAALRREERSRPQTVCAALLGASDCQGSAGDERAGTVRF